MTELSWALVAVVFFGGGSLLWAIIAIVWGVRHGQFRDFDQQARTIFDDVESEGTPTDFFPGEGPPPSEYLL